MFSANKNVVFLNSPSKILHLLESICTRRHGSHFGVPKQCNFSSCEMSCSWPVYDSNFLCLTKLSLQSISHYLLYCETALYNIWTGLPTENWFFHHLMAIKCFSWFNSKFMISVTAYVPAHNLENKGTTWSVREVIIIKALFCIPLKLF